jgi:hypothetical protein
MPVRSFKQAKLRYYFFLTENLKTRRHTFGCTQKTRAEYQMEGNTTSLASLAVAFGAGACAAYLGVRLMATDAHAAVPTPSSVSIIMKRRVSNASLDVFP